MTNVIKLTNRPRTFTSSEDMIEAVRQQIFKDGRKYQDIAHATGVCKGTINNLASGKTYWPRPRTLFPLLTALGYELKLVKSHTKE